MPGSNMQVIPAIDLLDGKAVRLRQGRYDEVTVYSDDPPGLAAEWREQVSILHLIDLEGARAGRAVQADLVARVVNAFGAGVQVGGGVRSLDALRSYFDLGVEKVVMGTAAIRDPDLLREAVELYPGRVIVGLDAKDGWVATDGWLDVSTKRATDMARELSELPIAALLYTDIARDGTEVGPNIEATRALALDGGLPVIASGGVGTTEHLRQLALAARQCEAEAKTRQSHAGIVGAIVGRALHEKRFSLAEALESAHVP